jgi:hypothetical protein
MHEVSELVQLAAPIASVGGVAAMMRLKRVHEARRVLRSTSPQSARDTDPRRAGEDKEIISE